MTTSKYRFETLALHGGQTPDPTTLSRGVPVYRTSSYIFRDTEHAANLFGLKELGNIYSRLMNPTNDVLEQRISLLEGGAASVALASGTSAIHYSVINIARAGDEIVAANNLYGGTYTMFDAILPQLGIKTTFVDSSDPINFARAITKKTRLIFIETIGNPALDFTDIAAISAVAKEHNLPLVVDGTFTTPYLLRAIEHGADVVVNSLTKWMGGHGTAIGGSVTDAGTFNWQDDKFNLYNEPDPNYHGLRWAHDLPESLAPVAFALRLRTVPLRNLGACLSPDNAWMFLQGLETLPFRMERHCQNAIDVARFLKSHPCVEWVRYPGLEDDRTYETASRYLENGFGAMVVFGVKGGKEKGEKFINSLQLFSHLANVGDAKSLALHPASTSHSQLSEKQQQSSGVSPELVRLSIGLEHIDDIIDDINSALAKVAF
ncbi:O-acetylhomoserine aminocarboxypropyltransferase/cysteine synthase family protein [Desulfurispira natronophila]|uniref:O-acetylhomoserine (Thiol)-lyase n=1 Tax=Desulfurispira natronophila TaxID=682562 RepID=A0A7W7Y2T6_9BACT|nr:aminotransferase class I/II-fold pyridoxal phosphate-dependent enzyme [Desulfurispira natronophila]MBB5020889.1 O-acetylhomoserine (thiol)-lyase [Desulfurispira natronophila]